MAKSKDISGQRFGKLVAKKKTDKKAGHRGYLWECKCDCGNTAFVAISDLTSGNTQSCGCVLNEKRENQKQKRKDIIGDKYGKLTVVEVVGVDKYRAVLYKCKCDCGNETILSKRALVSNNTTSCGCVGIENRLNNMILKPHDTREKYTRLSSLNQKISVRNKTGVKGVFKHKNGSFVATIGFKKDKKYLGMYPTLEEATKARKRAEEEYFEPVLNKYGKELKGDD
jgi:hypothetical protein